MPKTYDLSDVTLNWSSRFILEDMLIVNGRTIDGRNVTVSFTIVDLAEPPFAVDTDEITATTRFELHHMYDVEEEEGLCTPE